MFAEDPKLINISPNELVQKVNNPQVFHRMFNYSKQRRLIQARTKYNLESRNINKFVREINDMKKKLKQRQQQFSKRQNSERTKKYDQNQLKQLEFNQFQKKDHQQKIQKIQKIRTQPIQNSPFKIRKDYKSKIEQSPSTFLSNFSKSQQRRSSILQRKIGFPQLQKKKRSMIEKTFQSFNLGLIDPPRLKISHRNEQLKKRAATITPQKNTTPRLSSDRKIEISTQNMKKYKKHLNILLYGQYDEDQLPDTVLLNQLVIQRYKIGKNPFQNNENGQQTFSIPYCDFSNKKIVNQSIRQFINMSIEKCQKISFEIYDKNHNGVIDQKDLIKLMQMTDYLPQLNSDLLAIINYTEFQLPQRDLSSKNYLCQSDQSQESMIRKDEIIQIPSQISVTKSRKIKTEQNQQGYSSTSFKKQKFYALLQSKSQLFKAHKRISRQKAKVYITWGKFKQIFAGRRPALFFDLIKYIFNCETSQFIFPKSQRKQKSERTQKSSREKVIDLLRAVHDIEADSIQVQLF